MKTTHVFTRLIPDFFSVRLKSINAWKFVSNRHFVIISGTAERPGRASGYCHQMEPTTVAMMILAIRAGFFYFILFFKRHLRNVFKDLFFKLLSVSFSGMWIHFCSLWNNYFPVNRFPAAFSLFHSHQQKAAIVKAVAQHNYRPVIRPCSWILELDFVSPALTASVMGPWGCRSCVDISSFKLISLVFFSFKLIWCHVAGCSRVG